MTAQEHQHPDLDTLARCLQHALDMADYLTDNDKAITDFMIDSMGDLPPSLDADEYREIARTLATIERLQHAAVMRACA